MSGILLPGLTLVFVALKLTGHIDWSWWFVLLPFWLPLALAIGYAMVKVALMPRNKRLK